MEDAPVQLDVVVRSRDEVLIEEREGDLVARAVDDQVGLDDGPVDEAHLPAFQRLDIRLRRDRAVLDAIEDPPRDRRVRLAEAVGRAWAARSARAARHSS